MSHPQKLLERLQKKKSWRGQIIYWSKLHLLWCYSSFLLWIKSWNLCVLHAEMTHKSNNGAKNLYPIITEVQLHILCQQLIRDRKWFHLYFTLFKKEVTLRDHIFLNNGVLFVTSESNTLILVLYDFRKVFSLIHPFVCSQKSRLKEL